ncbi:VanZ family protein [Microbacterium deminutum]|uniref:VanZ-like domain-containing protein n=1 Tax=Microbacterium deminutum TaxID=344164 RepID=A0ABP5BGF6_9MICO
MTTRPPRRRLARSRIVGAVLLVCYLGFAAAVVLWPHRVDGDSLGVYRVLYQGYGHGLPRWITYNLVQFVANVLFAAPLGLFLAMMLPRRRWWVAVVICVTLFAAGELAQFFVPARMPSILDWLANSLGGLLGAVIWRLCSRPDRLTSRMY